MDKLLVPKRELAEPEANCFPKIEENFWAEEKEVEELLVEDAAPG